MPKWGPNLCRPSLLLTYCNRGCGNKGASKYHTPVFFFLLFFFFSPCLFVCFFRSFFAFRALRNSLSVSLSECAFFCPPRLAIYGGFCPSDEERTSELPTSLLLFFIFFLFPFFWFFYFLKVCFLVFWLKNHPEGFVCLVPLEERFWGFASLFCTQWWF